MYYDLKENHITPIMGDENVNCFLKSLAKLSREIIIENVSNDPSGTQYEIEIEKNAPKDKLNIKIKYFAKNGSYITSLCW